MIVSLPDHKVWGKTTLYALQKIFVQLWYAGCAFTGEVID